MARWKLCFVLLLPLTVVMYHHTKETLVKTSGREPDVTPICTNATLSVITLIVCKIRTERNGGEECRLLYQHGQDFEHKCDSRFTLMKENQTVFLHLTGLTPEDSGNYTCECSRPGGTDILHRNITMEEDEDANSSTQMPILSATVVIIITGVILGFIYMGIRHRRQPEPLSSHPNMVLYGEPHDIEPYSTFIRRESGLYSTARLQRL